MTMDVKRLDEIVERLGSQPLCDKDDPKPCIMCTFQNTLYTNQEDEVLWRAIQNLSTALINSILTRSNPLELIKDAYILGFGLGYLYHQSVTDEKDSLITQLEL